MYIEIANRDVNYVFKNLSLTIVTIVDEDHLVIHFTDGSEWGFVESVISFPMLQYYHNRLHYYLNHLQVPIS